MIVVGDFTSTMALTCQPDSLLRKVCCLLRTSIKQVTEKLPCLLKSTDYYPVLVFHVGASEGRKEENPGNYKPAGFTTGPGKIHRAGSPRNCAKTYGKGDLLQPTWLYKRET